MDALDQLAILGDFSLEANGDTLSMRTLNMTPFSGKFGKERRADLEDVIRLAYSISKAPLERRLEICHLRPGDIIEVALAETERLEVVSVTDHSNEYGRNLSKLTTISEAGETDEIVVSSHDTAHLIYRPYGKLADK